MWGKDKKKWEKRHRDGEDEYNVLRAHFRRQLNPHPDGFDSCFPSIIHSDTHATVPAFFSLFLQSPIHSCITSHEEDIPCTTCTTFGTPRRRQFALSLDPAGGRSSHVGRRLFCWPINGCFLAIAYSIRQILVSSISHSSRHTWHHVMFNVGETETLIIFTQKERNIRLINTFRGRGSCEYSSQRGKAAKQSEGMANRWHWGDTSCDVATTVNAADNFSSIRSWLRRLWTKILWFPMNWLQTDPRYDSQKPKLFNSSPGCPCWSSSGDVSEDSDGTDDPSPEVPMFDPLGIL